MFSDVPQYSEMFSEAPQCSDMFSNVPQCSDIFRDVPKCSEMYSDVPSAQLGLFFLLLGLRIFFQKFQVSGGKKIKIKISKIFNLKNILVLGNKTDKTK